MSIFDSIEPPVITKDGGTIDVATATAWHNLIRMYIDDADLDAFVVSLLTPDQARQLVTNLNTAIARVEEKGGH